MRDRPVAIGAAFAITDLDGEFVVWFSDGQDHGTALKRKPRALAARDDAARYSRLKRGHPQQLTASTIESPSAIATAQAGLPVLFG